MFSVPPHGTDGAAVPADRAPMASGPYGRGPDADLSSVPFPPGADDAVACPKAAASGVPVPAIPPRRSSGHPRVLDRVGSPVRPGPARSCSSSGGQRGSLAGSAAPAGDHPHRGFPWWVFVVAFNLAVAGYGWTAAGGGVWP